MSEVEIPRFLRRVADAGDETIATEVARDAYASTLALLLHGSGKIGPFGVQHVGGRILLTIEIVPTSTRAGAEVAATPIPIRDNSAPIV